MSDDELDAAMRRKITLVCGGTPDADSFGSLVLRVLDRNARLRADLAKLRAVADAARKLAASREKHRPHTSDCNLDWNDEPCNCALPELRAALSALDAAPVPHADETGET